MWFRVVLALLVASSTLPAQSPTTLSAQRGGPPPIEDNSFLVEEAYNQERGVVQHVSTFSRADGAEDWMYTFTQEWPFRSRTHQLSYTIPIARSDDAASGKTGVGDVAIHYRYQIGGGENTAFALAPRATVLLPTGPSRHALGTGGVGFQVNLPFSAVLPARLVAHSNVGMTYTQRARDIAGNSAPTRAFALGQSLVWLMHPKLNLMLESTWTRADEVVGPGQTAHASEFLLSPGLRAAIDFSSGLQIVPGIAFPFGVGGSSGEHAVFLYLSFEHPFVRGAQ